MKIAPLPQSDPWYRRIVNNDQVHSDALNAVPIESTVEMELVELLHGGPESNYRPYLHLRGELTEARPVVELPYGVTELILRRGSGLTVDAFYDFTPEQLSDLVGKGYFTTAFRVPDEMSGIPWTLPGKADFLVVAPELSDEPPVVFMNVHDQTGMEFDEASSGYELAAYFPDYSAEAETVQPADERALDEPERGGSGLDVFSDIALPEHDAVIEPLPGDIDAVRSLVPDGVFSRLVSEIQSQQEPELEEVAEEAEDEQTAPGSAWDVYMSRISPGVEHVLSGQHLEDESAIEDSSDAKVETDEQVQVAETDLLDEGGEDAIDAPPVASEVILDVLGDDQVAPDLTQLSLQMDDVSDDEHFRAAKRRASQMRAELANDVDGAESGDAEPIL